MRGSRAAAWRPSDGGRAEQQLRRMGGGGIPQVTGEGSGQRWWGRPACPGGKGRSGPAGGPACGARGQRGRPRPHRGPSEGRRRRPGDSAGEEEKEEAAKWGASGLVRGRCGEAGEPRSKVETRRRVGGLREKGVRQRGKEEEEKRSVGPGEGRARREAEESVSWSGDSGSAAGGGGGERQLGAEIEGVRQEEEESVSRGGRERGSAAGGGGGGEEARRRDGRCLEIKI